MNPTHEIAWWVPQVGKEEEAFVLDCIRSQYINEGEMVTRFENEIAKLLGCNHVIATTSGTAAIFLALKAYGIGVGDEVLVPDLTFIATANAVTLTGATPVLVDIDEKSLNLDPKKCLAKLTPKTKAIVPVHVSGRGAAMGELMRFAKMHGLKVIEDAAEAFCSFQNGKALGTIGHAGCFSFSPNKTITTGQGGVIVTNDESIVTTLRQLKDQGRPVRGTGGDDSHPAIGFNFKMTNLQAAVGLAQLGRLKNRIQRIKQHYEIYQQRLAGLAGIQLPGFNVKEGEVPQWVDAVVESRDAFDKALAGHHIHCRRFWHPLHTQPPYRADGKQFPVTTKCAARAIWLPSAYTLDDQAIKKTCDFIEKFLSINKQRAA